MSVPLTELRIKMEQLERELAELRAKVEQPNGRWWVDHAGRFADDPEFLKILKHGRAYRKSLRPKVAK